MATTEDQLDIPAISSLAEFRRWALSDGFPERGRIDYIGGQIEVDMSPEDFFAHATLKAEVCRALVTISLRESLGHVVTDSTRISSIEANLSVEPDVVYLSDEAWTSNRARFIPKASGEPGRYVELEGAPDLIVEIVSDSSVTKDTRRLPEAYYKAGVREFWLIDARHEALVFQIHHRGDTLFQPVTADPDGFQQSSVFASRFRLDRWRDKFGHWKYHLLEEFVDRPTE